MNKQFRVVSGTRYHPQIQQIRLNGVSVSERLTPKLARRACEVAIGRDYGASVWDNEHGHGYALYENTHRKLTADVV